MTIPEVRRSFEHIEECVDGWLEEGSRAEAATRLRKEWRMVFHRELFKRDAEEFIEHRATRTPSKKKRHSRYRTTRRKGGMAPVDYQTRAGVYLAPGQTPTAQGTLPLSSGASSSFGSFLDYLSSGFGVSVPQRAGDLDPVKGQAEWPSPMKGGSGGIADTASAVYRQALMRPIGPSAPPSVLSDLQSMAYGSTVGVSPSVPQRTPEYQLGKVYSGPL